MKNVKKTLLIALSFVLVAALTLVTTLALLTSEDSDVNTMTYGNVKIVQDEFERSAKNEEASGPGVNAYEYQDFTQDKALYPVTTKDLTNKESGVVLFNQLGTGVEEAVILEDENVQDKFVFVKNTGSSDAYVRTTVAYELGNLTKDFNSIIHTTVGSSWDVNEIGETTIKGKRYYLVEYVYNEALPAGQYTKTYSLGQVYMDFYATNEDCVALDGNANGKYDVLVFSQAVQTKGFANSTEAFQVAFEGTYYDESVFE